MTSPIFADAARQWVAMRAEFELVVQAAYEAAEEATNAHLLNRRGLAAGIDSYSLMTGPWARVEAYGSAELVEHFETKGRPALERFEREWLAARQGWHVEAEAPDVSAAWLAEWENTNTVERAGRAA